MRRARIWNGQSAYNAPSLPWDGAPTLVAPSSKFATPEEPIAAEHFNWALHNVDELTLRATQRAALTNMQSFPTSKRLRAACAYQALGGWFLANGVDDELDFTPDGDQAHSTKSDDNGDFCNAMVEAPDGSVHRFFTTASAIAPYRVKGTGTTALTGLSSWEGTFALRCGTDILAIGVASAAISVRKSAASATAYTTPSMPGSGTYSTSALWSGASNGTSAVFVPRNVACASNDFLIWNGSALSKGNGTLFAGRFCGAGYDDALQTWVMCTIDSTDAHFYTADDGTLSSATWTEVTSKGDHAYSSDMDFTVVAGAWIFVVGIASRTQEIPIGAFSAPDITMMFTLDSGTTWEYANAWLPTRASEPSRIRIVPCNDRVMIFHSDGAAASGCISG